MHRRFGCVMRQALRMNGHVLQRRATRPDRGIDAVNCAGLGGGRRDDGVPLRIRPNLAPSVRRRGLPVRFAMIDGGGKGVSPAGCSGLYILRRPVCGAAVNTVLDSGSLPAHRRPMDAGVCASFQVRRGRDNGLSGGIEIRLLISNGSIRHGLSERAVRRGGLSRESLSVPLFGGLDKGTMRSSRCPCCHGVRCCR